MRLLHAGDDPRRGRSPGAGAQSGRGNDPPGPAREHLPLHGLPADRRGDPGRGPGGRVPMIPATVGYVRPESLEEALVALDEPEAKALAGGQSLLPAMKLRLARPTLLVDLGGLGLRGVRADDGELAIGALTTWDELVRSDALDRPELAALSECAAGIGDLQVRNLG